MSYATHLTTFQVSSVQFADRLNQRFKKRGKHFLLAVPNLEYRTVENALCGNDPPVKKRSEPQAHGQSELLRYNRRLSDQQSVTFLKRRLCQSANCTDET